MESCVRWEITLSRMTSTIDWDEVDVENSFKENANKHRELSRDMFLQISRE